MINITSPGALISSMKSFIGGMVTDILPSGLKPYMSPNCLNVLPDVSIGGIETRTGSIIVGQLPSKLPCTFLFTFNKSDGSSIILVSDGATLWSTPDFKTFTSLKTGLTSTATMSACVVRNKVWLTNGSDSVMTYNSAGTLTVLDGTSGTPNVPKGRYIIFCQERPWIARTTDLPSIINFAALNDSSGNPIAPDNAAAWPAVNALYADQDDGDSIYGLISYLGQPFIFKSKSFGAVTGSDEYSYGYQRVTSNIGTRFHQCLIERDGVLEFIGPDGFYESQGSPATTVRVSDLIKTEFEKLIQPKVNDKVNIWTLLADWATGTFTNTKSGDTIIGGVDSIFLQDTLTTIDEFTSMPLSVDWTIMSDGGVNIADNKLHLFALPYMFLPWCRRASTIVYGTWQFDISNTFGGWNYAYRTTVKFIHDVSGNCYEIYSQGDFNTGLRMIYLNKHYNGVDTMLGSGSLPYGTGLIDVKVVHSHNGDFNIYSNDVLLFTANDNTVSSSEYLVVSSSCISANNPFNGYLDNLKITRYPITGVNAYVTGILDVGKGSDITMWGAFEVSHNLNGQTITYQVRTAATSNGIATATYHDILPGALISEALTTPFIQIKSTLVSTSIEKTPELQSLIINWVTGGTPVQKMCCVNFQNRNLLSAAQEGYTYNNIVWVKPKRIYKPEDMPAVFVPLSWRILSFCILNDILYAGVSYNDVSGTDEGAIIRLFTGYRDEVYSGAGTATKVAQAINSFFETRDENFELSMNKKKLMEIAVDYTPSGAGVLTLQKSTDGDALSTVNSLDNTGTSRTVKLSAIRGVLGRSHRLRLTINTIDQYMKVHGIEMIATPIKIRE